VCVCVRHAQCTLNLDNANEIRPGLKKQKMVSIAETVLSINFAINERQNE